MRMPRLSALAEGSTIYEAAAERVSRRLHDLVTADRFSRKRHLSEPCNSALQPKAARMRIPQLGATAEGCTILPRLSASAAGCMTSETATERVTAVLSSRRLHESGVLLTASAEGSTY